MSSTESSEALVELVGRGGREAELGVGTGRLPQWRTADAAVGASVIKAMMCIAPQRRHTWEYEREGWARRFFEDWRASLKWQRLEPYQKFAEMIDRHWDGIGAYCRPENKVSLGFVDGLNNRSVSSSAARTVCAMRSICA